MADAALPVSDSPDWDQLPHELRCPRCDYNLRLLEQPRCPECGLTFEWGRLIEVAAQTNLSPLFEFRWRDRPLRSLLLTMACVLLPGRVWRKADLTDRPRYAALGLLVLAVLVVACGPIVFNYVVTFLASLSYGRGWRVAFQTMPWSRIPGYALTVCVNPLVTMLAMLIVLAAAGHVFRRTYARNKILPVHVLRITVHAWTTWVLWWLIVKFAIEAAELAHAMTAGRQTRDFGDHAMWISQPVLVWALALGFARYLRLKRSVAAAVGITAIAVVALGVASVTSALGFPTGFRFGMPNAVDAFIEFARWSLAFSR